MKTMKIYRPCKTNLISQTFGVSGTQPSLIPFYNSLGLKAHDGIDFAVQCKDHTVKTGGQCENVYCNVIGTGKLKVVYIQKDIEGGFGVTVMDEMWNKFLWWHEDSFDPLIFLGQEIKLGTLLGVAGNTGKSTGAHIHFAYYRYGENRDNGYRGASDPMPWYDNRFCLDIRSQIEIIQKMIELIKQAALLFK